MAVGWDSPYLSRVCVRHNADAEWGLDAQLERDWMRFVNLDLDV